MRDYFLNDLTCTKALQTISGQALMEMSIPPMRYCIDQILPQGLAMLCGSPNTGKSWLALNWCIRIASGQPVWHFQTTQGTTLYLCLGDSWSRIQSRMISMKDYLSKENVFFAIPSRSVFDCLAENIEAFVSEHPDTVLVVINAFPIFFGGASSIFDNRVMVSLKELADRLQITILLLHHFSSYDSHDSPDTPTTASEIFNALDTTLILEKDEACQSHAKLTCFGKDIPYRELQIRFCNANHTWELISDSMENSDFLLPEIIVRLIEFMNVTKTFDGSIEAFTESFDNFCGKDIKANHLKNLMDRYKFELEDHNIFFNSYFWEDKYNVNLQYIPQLKA